MLRKLAVALLVLLELPLLLPLAIGALIGWLLLLIDRIVKRARYAAAARSSR